MLNSTILSQHKAFPPANIKTQTSTREQPDSLKAFTTIIAQSHPSQGKTCITADQSQLETQRAQQAVMARSETEAFIDFFTTRTISKESKDLHPEFKSIFMDLFLEIKKIAGEETSSDNPFLISAYLDFCWSAITKLLQDENLLKTGKIQNIKDLNEVLEKEKNNFSHFAKLTKDTDLETQKNCPELKKLLDEDQIKQDSNGRYILTFKSFPVLITIRNFLGAARNFHRISIPKLVCPLPEKLAQDSVFKDEIFKDLKIAFDYFLQNSASTPLSACFNDFPNAHNLLLLKFERFMLERKLNETYFNLCVTSESEIGIKIKEALKEQKTLNSKKSNQKLFAIKSMQDSLCEQEELLRQEIISNESKEASKKLSSKTFKNTTKEIQAKDEIAYLQRIKSILLKLTEKETEFRKQIATTMQNELTVINTFIKTDAKSKKQLATLMNQEELSRNKILLSQEKLFSTVNTTKENDAKCKEQLIELKNLEESFRKDLYSEWEQDSMNIAETKTNQFTFRQKLKHLYSLQLEAITQRETLLKQQLSELTKFKETLTEEINKSDNEPITSPLHVETTSLGETITTISGFLQNDSHPILQTIVESTDSSPWRYNPYNRHQAKTIICNRPA